MIEIYLYKYRHEKGWTQEELAKKSGVSASEIGLIENGRIPSVLIVFKLAYALEVDINELCKFTP